MQNLATKFRPSSSMGKNKKNKKGKYTFILLPTLSELIRLLSVSGTLSGQRNRGAHEEKGV
jgi:hypothetical protein